MTARGSLSVVMTIAAIGACASPGRQPAATRVSRVAPPARDVYAQGVGDNPRRFVGFELAASFFHDDPEHDDLAAIDEAQRRAIAASGPAAAAAFQFFTTGEHPFQRFLPYLDPRRRDDGASQDVVNAPFQGITVVLYVKPGTPARIAQQIAVDFELAQAFRPDEAATYAGLEASPVQTAAPDGGDLERIVAARARDPRGFAAAAARRALVDGSWFPDSDGVFRLRCVARALDGQRFGPAWIAEAKRRDALDYLLRVSSDRDAADVAGIVAQLDPQVAAVDQPLVPASPPPAPTDPLGPPPPADQVADPALVGSGERFYIGFHIDAFELHEDSEHDAEETVSEEAHEGMVAFEHFLTGDHPYAGLRAWLDPDRRTTQATLDQRNVHAVMVPWGLIDLFVYVKPKTPASVAQKLAIDVELAQIFRPMPSEFFAAYDEDDVVSDLESPIADLAGGKLFRALAFVGEPSRRAELLAKLDDQSDPGGDARVRLRALDRVFARKPFGADLIRDAAKATRPRDALAFLLLVASDVNHDELGAIARARP